MRLVSLVSTNTGVMLNLVTNDTQKVVDAATYFHFGEKLYQFAVFASIGINILVLSAFFPCKHA